MFTLMRRRESANFSGSAWRFNTSSRPPGLAFGEPMTGSGRDRYAVSVRFDTEADAFCNHEGQGFWVPAFAGTTLMP
jgi:hypothetical protein